ncbi:hypothetical protein KBX35_10140 [Micromonospora sp. C32]|uniref:hypothetical protein n=1 Tax=Micromonospora sp. C32 TaxID=2824877 RepID=UPI001B3808C8|nr:hypothetical protein [Micromonospora sp. C32]MBQ1055146.1 hypothetical protein [Micromonospora sp. C32]
MSHTITVSGARTRPAYRLAATRLWLRGGPDEVRSLVAGLDLVRQVAREDTSEAWLCMIGNGTAHYLSTYASDEVLARLYAGANEVYGVVAPVGRLGTGADGGAVVDGCWRFGSGADRAAYMAMGCEPVAGRRTTVLIERAHLRVESVWAGPGLLATGSHTLRADGVRLRPDDVLDMSVVPSGRPTGIYADGQLFLANMPGVAIGLAERLLELLGPGLPAGSSWHASYADAFARTVLARRSLTGLLQGLDALAREGRLGPLAPVLRAEYNAVLCAAYHVCLDAVVTLTGACDTDDADLREQLTQARVDALTMKPHGAMRPAVPPAPASTPQEALV